MSFTDEDLKRLKDYFKSPGWEYWSHGLDADLIEAIVYRLEAAEKVCEACAKVVRIPERIQNAPRELAISDAIEVWRKAAGK